MKQFKIITNWEKLIFKIIIICGSIMLMNLFIGYINPNILGDYLCNNNCKNIPFLFDHVAPIYHFGFRHWMITIMCIVIVFIQIIRTGIWISEHNFSD